MTTPSYLQPGDCVALVATARKVSPAEMESAVRLFTSWGLRVRQPEGLYADCHQFAGDDTARAALLQRQLDDPDVRAIVCVRGGYGTVRIIDRLDFSRFAHNPKWIVGYSDVTVLHSHLRRHLRVETLHATMPIDIPPDADCTSYPSTDTLRHCLFGEAPLYRFAPAAGNRIGKADGPLVGGNLSILYSLCGSPSDIDTDGAILFIEDLDEYLYHIDRMMQNLRRCGKLARLRGLVVGALSQMHDNTVPFGRTAEEIVSDAVRDYDYPVCFGAPAGHIGTDNHALILGRTAHLQVTSQESVIDER